ncbi:aldo/keto reductase [Brachyspira pilosicoli]|mgnify:FL=1|uniref:Aldo/keto reductase n=2 Tax=Brachyspira pilosicoli TaxID=52584 RepID=A0AAJ6GBI7_BRAPL|nr:aldo/keto reductase [Brachyspira pilosicoli]AFR70042.1 aldo/keto reductase [Brachyspira pilosicoli B2904]MBW5392477.1 L-glyceraldehyde 3-phosphate reductase [Brachyspira pilosicoli]MBW5399986.1 L-glyceraldehyde 3-phosphate reductase [Brachyspira pilosicoli]WIH82379.1 aldo/keto reductase [Brachyspira pilosicoli]WIH84596.1 aldo/keto reductase [Brachyspira pilosicoli]
MNRYDNMIFNRCGKSGLKLPIISLGLWHNFGENCDYNNMKDIINTAFDNGITHFDLANNYGPPYGAAEINMGKILNDGFNKYRDEIIISTKAGYDMWDGPYGNWGSKKYLIASINQSLKRLNLEYVDIFYHHRMDSETPLEETMEALTRIVKSGKALYVGLSNYDGATMERASKILTYANVPFIINQNRYSIFDRTIESNGLKLKAKKLSKGIIAYSPLAQGLLTDKYIDGIPNDSRIAVDGRYLKKDAITRDRLRQIKELNDLAKERGETLAQMALRWVLKDEEITSVLIGASKPSQIIENLKIINKNNLTDLELKKIDDITL